MGQPTEFNIYGYDPSVPAAALFFVLYNLWLGAHAYLSLYRSCRRANKYRYTIPLFVAALLSVLGYGVRIGSCYNTASIPLYAQSQSYIVIAPIFVCATLYLLLKHLILYCLPDDDGGKTRTIFKLPPHWLGRIFICSDIFSFLTQCAGSGIASSGNWEGNTKDIGVNVLLTGLALQLATFTFYLAFLFRFCRRGPTAQTKSLDRPVRPILIGMWIASTFVQIRTVYRVVEFALGIDGYPFQHEWCLYVFEAVPMFVALGALAYSHPIRWLGESSGHNTTAAAAAAAGGAEKTKQVREPGVLC